MNDLKEETKQFDEWVDARIADYELLKSYCNKEVNEARIYLLQAVKAKFHLIMRVK